MADLERDLVAARPAWPEPSPAAEAAARAALGLAPRARSPRSWAAGGARRRGTLIVVAALLVTGGAAVAATIIGGGGRGAPAPRAASLAFDPVHTIDTAADPTEGAPSLAVDGRGVVTVVWGRAGRIVASTRTRGGEWSRPERLSDPSTRATYPRAGADREGSLTVTWRERTAGRQVSQDFVLPSGAPAGRLEELVERRWAVVSRTRTPKGVWSPIERVSPDTATVRDLEEPGLVVSSGGEAMATWDVGGTMWASRRPPDGAWESPVAVGAGAGEAVDGRLAGSSSGRAILVWSNRVGDGDARHYEIRAAAADPEGSWEDAELVDASGRNPPHAIGALDDRGDAAVAWSSEGPGSTESFASSRPAGGSWAARSRLGADPGLFGFASSIAVDASGRSIVLSGTGVSTSTRAAGGPWRPFALTPGPGRAVGATITTDATGAPVIVRSTFRPSQRTVERVAPGAARAGRPSVVPGLGPGAVVAAGRDGTVALAWIAGAAPVGLMVSVAEGPR